ncbi:uncharacterized protein LOC112450593 [Kryptolebias marmoratus]|uniref:uncharacterized protein LOC112450593 n=1 Tax=Kryptolebias marmoratus TaxID=37003 RepID=UPI000D531059|nr:uncharacterized protein LOC112450593 [Kryptolebias marmoratus]
MWGIGSSSLSSLPLRNDVIGWRALNILCWFGLITRTYPAYNQPNTSIHASSRNALNFVTGLPSSQGGVVWAGSLLQEHTCSVLALIRRILRGVHCQPFNARLLFSTLISGFRSSPFPTSKTPSWHSSLLASSLLHLLTRPNLLRPPLALLLDSSTDRRQSPFSTNPPVTPDHKSFHRPTPLADNHHSQKLLLFLLLPGFTPQKVHASFRLLLVSSSRKIYLPQSH